ncbi:asparagine synthase C-terminal domain-containing protein [Roseobacter sp. HKCCD7870]|uniref:asparagine synthase C-terminal domain-containing protein n=1 Tax=Roseobacter sp. HKCCD7870 TaxID=3120343 RepID=UPI0030EE9F25
METMIALLENTPGWHQFVAGNRKLWLAGPLRETQSASVIAQAATISPEQLPAWLDRLDGHYALVLIGSDWSIAAVDPSRTIPLIYAEHDGSVLVAQVGTDLAGRIGLGPDDILTQQARAFALAGYTIGKATLYRRVYGLLPGQFLFCSGDTNLEVRTYHHWRPCHPENIAPEDLYDPLSTLHESIISNLVASAQGRPILVPLSAGIDSRFIASGLVEAGYRNVRCFTYGLAGNREAYMSKKIAERLGLPWTFVPYTNRSVRAVTSTPDHVAYERYADSFSAIPYPQDYPALVALRARHDFDPNTIVVNGNTGDFISGNHILPSLTEPQDDGPGARLSRIVDALVSRHFKHWATLETSDRLAEVRRLLADEIEGFGGLPDNPAGDHGIYEMSEFINRQCKYVVNGQRCYEWLRLSWRLPLWDRALLDFWEKAPLVAKYRQCLYREVLQRDNWGGVWRDLPINPTRIRPGWIVPLRLLAKVAHAPLGRARWNRFEKQYLEYWMAPMCSYATWPYIRVARDKRGHSSAIGWHIERYLLDKGLSFGGDPRHEC